MPTTPNDLVTLAEQHHYSDLFIRHLYWNAPDMRPLQHTAEDHTLTATNIATFKGIRVWECPELPGSQAEADLDRLIAATSVDRIVIFHDDNNQVWRWPVRRHRGTNTTVRLTRHRHHTGQPDPAFRDRLTKIQLPLEEELSANDVLTRVREAFDVEAENETKRASRLMANLYTALEKAYPDTYPPTRRDHEISVTLARVLFLVFGDDTDMWRPDAFRDYIHHHTNTDASNLAAQLNALFTRLNQPGDPDPDDPDFGGFRYVNGGIFAEPITIPTSVGTDFRQALITACEPDWSTISPAIFGSMFQSVRDATTRRQLGEHYTSEENILRTLNPLFLNELRADYEEALARQTDQKRINALQRLRQRLAQIRYLDPACGCGNFIIVAYRELRDLELRIMESLAHLQGTAGGQRTLGGDLVRAIGVTLDHFAGIEIDEWPAKIAQTAMFLIDRQCDLKLKETFGAAPERLPIQTEAHIVVGNALRLDWDTVVPAVEDTTTIVAGNPPFLGHASRTEQQADDLRHAWHRDDISRLDYVTGWYAKTMAFMNSRFGVWAFVSTNSVTQGDPVPHLFKPIFAAGWRIKFAWTTFAWTSEAARKAAVHCVIIGFTKQPGDATLHTAGNHQGQQVDRLNGYLAAAPLVYAEKRSLPLGSGLPPVTFGNMPRDDGNLVVETDEYDMVASDPIAARYLRPYIGADELIKGKQRWCLWLTDATTEELNTSPILHARTEAVRQFRLKSTAASTRAMAATPHLFGQRPALYTTPYLIIPSVSSEARPYLPVLRVPASTIASNLTYTSSDPDGYVFALMSSALLMEWLRGVGGRLESRLRFTNTIVWNNLPSPAPSSAQRTRIIAAGEAVQQVRTELGGSLATLYPSNRPLAPQLQAAHDALDQAVDAMFGVTDPADRITTLFERLEQMTR